MTIAEANKLNGNAEPTFNGIPYSQYKADMEAKQSALKTTTVQPQVPEQFKLQTDKKWQGNQTGVVPNTEPQKIVTTTTPPAPKLAGVIIQTEKPKSKD